MIRLIHELEGRPRLHWDQYGSASLITRQRLMLNRLLDEFIGRLTTSKWAAIAKCSQDTALRDTQDLIKRRILQRDAPSGRSTSYSLRVSGN